MLNIENLEQNIGLQNQVERAIFQYEKVKNDAKTLTESDIVHELIENVKKYGGACLYLRLNHAQGLFDDAQFGVCYLWLNLFSEFLQELYIDELKERGKPAIIGALHYFLQSGAEAN